MYVITGHREIISKKKKSKKKSWFLYEKKQCNLWENNILRWKYILTSCISMMSFFTYFTKQNIKNKFLLPFLKTSISRHSFDNFWSPQFLVNPTLTPPNTPQVHCNAVNPSTILFIYFLQMHVCIAIKTVEDLFLKCKASY